MLNLLNVLFLVFGLTSAQGFGKDYNHSILVNFIDEHDAKLYDESKFPQHYPGLCAFYFSTLGDVTYLEEQKWYIGGKRVQGDSFKTDTANKYDFPETRDFHLELKFPKQNDFYITHISCLVEQSSSIGRAYIVDGGIGLNFMNLVFEAKRTRYFYYIVYVFGRTYQQ